MRLHCTHACVCLLAYVLVATYRRFCAHLNVSRRLNNFDVHFSLASSQATSPEERLGTHCLCMREIFPYIFCKKLHALPCQHVEDYAPIVSEKGPMGGTHYFVLRQGGGWIFVTSLYFTTQKRPCLHYHNPQKDIARQHTCPVQA